MINIEIHSESFAVRTAKEATEQWDTMRKKMLDDGKTNEEVKTTMGPPNIYVVLRWIKEMLDVMEDGEFKTAIPKAVTAPEAHMGNNPANLPIPPLNVNAKLRIRTKTGKSFPFYSYRFTTALLVQGNPMKSTMDLDRRADLDKLAA